MFYSQRNSKPDSSNESFKRKLQTLQDENNQLRKDNHKLQNKYEGSEYQLKAAKRQVRLMRQTKLCHYHSHLNLKSDVRAYCGHQQYALMPYTAGIAFLGSEGPILLTFQKDSQICNLNCLSNTRPRVLFKISGIPTNVRCFLLELLPNLFTSEFNVWDP